MKLEQYTDYRKVVTGSKEVGSNQHCYMLYGNLVCNQFKNNQDIVSEVPIEAKRDANETTRLEFKDACGCKNKDYQHATTGTLTMGDITYSMEYLREGWYKQSQKQYRQLKPSKFYKKIKSFQSDREKHCLGKEAYFKKQSWYKLIPSID